MLCFALGSSPWMPWHPPEGVQREGSREAQGECAEAPWCDAGGDAAVQTAVKAYAKGCTRSVQWCDARWKTDPNLMMGGKIQIQKALGLDANGKEDDALEVYRACRST